VVDGTGAMLPKYARKLDFPANIRVSVLPAVYPDQYGNDPAALRNGVRAAMAQRLKEMRGLPRAPHHLSFREPKLFTDKLKDSKVSLDISE